MLLCDCQSFIKESYLLTYSCYGTGVGAAAIWSSRWTDEEVLGRRTTASGLHQQ